MAASPEQREILYARLGGLMAARVDVYKRQDVTFVAPRQMNLTLPVGTRMSLFPMGTVTGESVGLRWPINGLHFAPDGRIGTSNEVAASQVSLRFDADRMLVILPLRQLSAVLRGLGLH